MKKYTLTELINSKITTEKMIVEDILYGDTVSILSADPKIGKTTLALQLANAISQGDLIFNKKCLKTQVAYFFLDDNESVIKSRLNKMEISQNDNLHLLFIEPCSIDVINDYVINLKKENPEIGFIIIDMLNDIRSIDSSNEYSNVAIKKDINHLRNIATNENIGMLILHHNRKSDALNKNSRIMGGTQTIGSINGAILALCRDSAQNTTATLEISGRNISSSSIQLEFDKEKIKFIESDKPLIEMNQELVKIINHIYSNGEFIGSAQELCAEIGITTDPRKIGKLIKANISNFEENGIIIEHKKSNGKRFIHLTINPEYIIDEGAIGSSSSNALN